MDRAIDRFDRKVESERFRMEMKTVDGVVFKVPVYLDEFGEVIRRAWNERREIGRVYPARG